MSNVLILRSCHADMASCGGFQWPSSGPVEADDWDGVQPVCGGKLNGFLWGEGGLAAMIVLWALAFLYAGA